MTRPKSRRANRRIDSASRGAVSDQSSSERNYFRIRDFEYVQPLYDLAFLLEVEALARDTDVPKYRTFSLWRAGYSLDGYGTTIDCWLDGAIAGEALDYVPSSRIREYLITVRQTGTIPELRSYRGERYERCLRLRSVRGLGPSKIALTILPHSLAEEWFSQTASHLNVSHDRIVELYHGNNRGPWQTAHVVPPLLRFLDTVQAHLGEPCGWVLDGIVDPFEAIDRAVSAAPDCAWASVARATDKALKTQRLFRRSSRPDDQHIEIKHQMGWTFRLTPKRVGLTPRSIPELATALDPIASAVHTALQSDLHLHTAWSDGSASVNTMATAIATSGLKYFAVTDHSRSSKLQGGLTPLLWLRQANALTLATPVCPVLHGIEVDILRDGTLDLPHSILRVADLVVASVHSNWTNDIRANTDRLLRAIESGCVDILAHPTSAIVGKPGVPDYCRPPADVEWREVFAKCALWDVAVEMNCFPSRLDLPLGLLNEAIAAGCAISIGSDAHARSHLLNLRFGEAALARLRAAIVLNRLTLSDLQKWIRDSRAKREGLSRQTPMLVQADLQFDTDARPRVVMLDASIHPPQVIPDGSRVVGIDLTAGDKATGVALLDGLSVEACSLFTDDEILDYVKIHCPRIVSIDSPLGLPGGGADINPDAGIVRVAEQDLASVGIPAYPALIDSMEKLTLRGIRLRHAIEKLERPPRVIESYPGAAQDILCIPRKQRSLDLLREGLRRLGLRGSGLDTKSHDEMDAITSAIVARYFEGGMFEPMGIPAEAQLIVPKVRPLLFDNNPIICVAGKTGAGKSVVARYLSVFYGFEWVRTRDVIRELLVEDQDRPLAKRWWNRTIDVGAIADKELRAFGAVILETYKQVPLRRKLTEIVGRLNAPVVVDSIRDSADVDREALASRPVLTWFVDCSDSVILKRLSHKKLGEKRINTPSPVDKTAPRVQRTADHIIPNLSSLEDLRWSLDDALFAITRLRR